LFPLGQPSYPGAEQILDRVRHRQVVADTRQLAVRECPTDLEREQRVAHCRVDQAPQQRARKAEAEPVVQELASRTEAERADVEACHRRSDRMLERGRPAGARREQIPHRGRLQPPGNEREHVQRMRVEPLDIVDRDHQRPGPGRAAQHVEEAESDRPHLRWRTDRVGTQDDDIQRPPLRCGQGVELVGADIVEKVDHGREREPRLGTAGPRRENPATASACRSDGGLPERRLADPGSAVERQRARAVGTVEEVEQQREFRLAPDRRRPPPSDGCQHCVLAA
jgi:hypothetical protein